MRIYFSGNAQENCSPEQILAGRKDLAVMLTFAEMTKKCKVSGTTVSRMKAHVKKNRKQRKRSQEE